MMQYTRVATLLAVSYILKHQIGQKAESYFGFKGLLSWRRHWVGVAGVGLAWRCCRCLHHRSVPLQAVSDPCARPRPLWGLQRHPIHRLLQGLQQPTRTPPTPRPTNAPFSPRLPRPSSCEVRPHPASSPALFLSFLHHCRPHLQGLGCFFPFQSCHTADGNREEKQNSKEYPA